MQNKWVDDEYGFGEHQEYLEKEKEVAQHPLQKEKQKRAEALKFDSDKPGMDLLPVAAKREIAAVFDFGAKKYARHNWRNGFNYSRLIAAAERHIDFFNDGEDLDPESGKSHLAHAGCCIMMLLESVLKGYGTDHRFKNGMD